MLAALEGVKIRAVYEPHIASDSEQRVLVEGLLAILLDPGTGAVTDGLIVFQRPAERVDGA